MRTARANTTGQQQTQGGGNQSLDAIAVAQATSLIRMNEIYPASSSTMASSSTSGGKVTHTSLGTLQRYATFDTAKETKNAINCLRTPAFSMQSTTWSTRGDDGLARVANLKALSEGTLKDASPVDARASICSFIEIHAKDERHRTRLDGTRKSGIAFA